MSGQRKPIPAGLLRQLRRHVATTWPRRRPRAPARPRPAGSEGWAPRSPRSRRPQRRAGRCSSPRSRRSAGAAPRAAARPPDRRRAPACRAHLLGGDASPRTRPSSPASSSTRSISSRFDEDASPSGQRAAERAHGVDAPGSSGSCSRYMRSIRAHDLPVDLFTGELDAELVVHVGRPLRRAHAEHRRGRLLAPAPAGRADELLAWPRSTAARNRQDAVEVEDHRVDHRRSNGCSDGVQAQAAPRSRGRPSRSSIVCSTE